MDELREKMAREIARSHGCEFDSGYGAAHQERFLRDADRILAIPEMAGLLRLKLAKSL